MKHINLYCPTCHRVLGSLMFDGEGFDVTLPCSHCGSGPRFVRGRPPQPVTEEEFRQATREMFAGKQR